MLGDISDFLQRGEGLEEEGGSPMLGKAFTEWKTRAVGSVDVFPHTNCEDNVLHENDHSSTFVKCFVRTNHFLSEGGVPSSPKLHLHMNDVSY